MTQEHGKRECIELAERLSEYLDGELPEELRGHVEEHFDGCAACEKFLTSLRRVKGLGHLLPKEELPPQRLQELSDSVRRKLDS